MTETLSPEQLLILWSELWKAYFKKNGYGGDTAEIYAYTLMPNSPVGYTPEMERKAAVALFHVLKKFEKSIDCDIWINSKKLGNWLKKYNFNHRVHITIMPKEC